MEMTNIYQMIISAGITVIIGLLSWVLIKITTMDKTITQLATLQEVTEKILNNLPCKIHREYINKLTQDNLVIKNNIEHLEKKVSDIEGEI